MYEHNRPFTSAYQYKKTDVFRLAFLVRKQLLLRKETIMKTVSSLLSPRLCSYPLSLIGHLEDILFVDIETTGFTARSSCLYLIGAIYFEKDQIHLMQFFAEKKRGRSRCTESIS